MRRNSPSNQTEQPSKPKMKINPIALARAGISPVTVQMTKEQIYSLPEVPKGVIPKQAKIACDSMYNDLQSYAMESIFSEGIGFLGYPYLAQLAQRTEYRKPAEIIAKEMTRKWLEIICTGDEDKSDKIKQIEAEFKRLDVQELFGKAVEHDCYYGRSQIFINTGEDDNGQLNTPLAVSKTKVGKGAIKSLKVVEPYWTYPSTYNSTRPLDDDFFKPKTWFVMGQEIHLSRFLQFVAREVSDIFKPVYNFGGLSLTQILKPYVDNWLRTRQSVSDLIHSFSVSVLKTDMSSILGGEEGDNVFTRIEMFNRFRDNRGVFAVDKDTEDFTNVSSPLSTLDHLQAQSQEHMASAAGIPLIILLKITPSGLNASSDGEIRTFYDWIQAQQESLLTPNIQRLLEMVQLSLFGEIDTEIGFKWNPLWSMDETATANCHKVEADTDVELINAGVIDPSEARKRLAQQEDSAYAGLDLTVVPELPGMENGLETFEEDDGELPGMDKEFVESEHPRAPDGKFGEGTGSASVSSKPVENLAAIAKKAKAKSVKTKFNGGQTIEFPKGVSEQNYDELLGSADELLTSLKGNEKATNAGYIKRAIEHGQEDKKYIVSMQFDEKNGIIGGASMYPIADSIRIEAIGGVGKGGGVGCMLSAIRASKKAGKGGAVTLTPVRDPKTVEWYLKLGFDMKPDSRYGEFWLSPEAAINLEKRFK